MLPKQFLLILQIAVPICLIVCVLLQQKGAALGGAFGGEGGFYSAKRGAEKKIFFATIILGTLFLLISLLNLIM